MSSDTVPCAPTDRTDDPTVPSPDGVPHDIVTRAPGAVPTTSATPAVATPEAPAVVSSHEQPRSAAPSARRRTPVKLVLLLGSMAALGALTTDMYLPSLPEVVTDLAAGEASVQFTITATLIGGALGQLLIGPLSDKYGRRLPVLVGIVVHIVSSILCMMAAEVMPLIALRMIQGMGNAAAGVVAVAVIRDRLSGAEASAVLSRLMLVIGVAPLLAPTIGGVIASIWDWRMVFAALALYGVALFVIVWRFLPESLPAERRNTGSARSVLGSYRVLLRDRQFVALALLPGLGMAALFAYVSGSPFVIREGYGLSEHQFSLLFALNGIGLVLGSQLNAALVRKFAPIRLMRLALPISTMLAIALLVVAATGTGGLIGLCIPLWLMLFVNALVPPNASALALTRHGERAGAAAALIGFSQAGVAGSVAPLVGVLGASATAMAIVIVGAMIASTLVLALGTPAYRRGGWTA
ncbi:multidrug effflux MFS transporter [Ruania alba]|uniref:MFS transporter, DHA1 family, bicyclomycin/chloramphenicol resistance protein n=1 Tax=Ruania alba TaxID=648782 RepID=A0A1H5D6C7_9MICO|nr:multidrug effflux MFS transporter [Ruania alba]SED74407.1 MFS transporter, DHA1 family, bicyclomycin/chloramphenicol resistance protein [Ruania alba]